MVASISRIVTQGDSNGSVRHPRPRTHLFGLIYWFYIERYLLPTMLVPCLASVNVFVWTRGGDDFPDWRVLSVLWKSIDSTQAVNPPEAKSQSGVIVFHNTALKIPETRWDWSPNSLFLLFIVNKEFCSYQVALCREFLPSTCFDGDSRSSNAALCLLSHTHPRIEPAWVQLVKGTMQLHVDSFIQAATFHEEWMFVLRIHSDNIDPTELVDGSVCIYSSVTRQPNNVLCVSCG